MRFLIDENVPLRVATALEGLGHDCFVVAPDGPSAVDDDLMAFARRDNRILVTFDADFGRMIFHELEPHPPGVVYMRGRPQHARLVSDLFVTIFQTGSLDLLGRFVIIEPGGSVRNMPLG